MSFEIGPVADICRKAGISQATYFNWKKTYGRLSVPKTLSSCLS
jgi:putative transposase